MYALSISKSTSDILRVIPCSLPEFTSEYANRDDAGVEYEFVDLSAFSDSKDVGDFLSHPYHYTLMLGRDPSDNRLLKKETATAVTKDIVVSLGDTNIAIPDGMHYLAIKTLTAAGGRGSSSLKGGCGSSIQNVVVDVTNASTLFVSLGKAGDSNDPNAYPLVIKVDGNTIYKLGGGRGSLDDSSKASTHPEDLYEPDAGSGGFWTISIGGPVMNGNNRSTSGAISGYGGGGDYNQDGQPPLADMFFSDVRPNIDGPLISNRRVPTHSKTSTRYDGSPITLGAGSSTIHVSQDKPYLCLISACSGGGYGDKVVGGQGASQSVIWWALYPFQAITFNVGKGGDSTSLDGGDTSITYNYKGKDYTLLLLSGGKSTGKGGLVPINNGTNSFNGKDNCSTHPDSVIGNYGSGGTIGNIGADGTLTYAFCSSSPSGVKVYDSLEDPVYIS